MGRRQLVCWLLCALGTVAPLSLATAADLPRAAPAEHGLDAEQLQRIGGMLEQAVEQRRIAGGVALVARHGEIVYFDAVGQRDVEQQEPMTEDTIFRIASMTKLITSVAIMMLREQGKLQLDDPLSRFIPEFAEVRVLRSAEDNPAEAASGEARKTEPADREITIHDLLTHTSGISYRFVGRPGLGDRYSAAGVSDGLVETPGTIGDNVRRLAEQPLLFQPGEAWEYGLSIDVLGRVVEVASGQTLAEFFREHIFQPLKMGDTHFALPRAKRDRLAALYRPNEQGRIERVGREPVEQGSLVYSATYPLQEPHRYYSGGAGLVSTAGDYARFLQMLFNGGQLEGVRILRPETVELMTQNQIGDLPMWIGGHGDRFGYGFAVLTEAGRSQNHCLPRQLLLGRHLLHVCLGGSASGAAGRAHDADLPLRPPRPAHSLSSADLRGTAVGVPRVSTRSSG